jgi:hypothetical protein
MWRSIGKVIGPSPLLQTICSFTDHILCIYIALVAKLETTNKALAKERDAQQVIDLALWAFQETGSALTQDLQFAHASSDILKGEL